MDDELNLELDNQEEEKLKANNRFQKLSEKVIITAKEKDQAEAKAKAAEEAQLKAEKERDFFRDFSQMSSKYPQATAFQDKILEKVNNGYSTEDAMFAVLGKEGKLDNQPASQPMPDNIAGGSASTSVREGDKEFKDMSQDERRNVLTDLEKEGVNFFKM